MSIENLNSGAIESFLERLHQIDRAEQDLQNEKDYLINLALPAEVKAALTALEETFAPKLSALEAERNGVINEIKVGVTILQKRVDSAHFMAMPVSGRISWDSKGLNGYAVAHPEILQFRNIGEPSVVIRRKESKE